MKEEMKRNLEIIEDTLMDRKLLLENYIKYCDYIINCYNHNIDIDYEKYFELLNYANVIKPIELEDLTTLEKYRNIISNYYNQNKKTK